jgi:hypothetical protein
MLRKTLFAACLLVASGSAMADHNDYGYGRVVTVEPSVSISYSSGRYSDSTRILYQTGGSSYLPHCDYRPRDVIYAPRPVYVQPVYYNNYYRGGHHRGWRDRDDWRDRGRGHGRGHDDD